MLILSLLAVESDTEAMFGSGGITFRVGGDEGGGGGGEDGGAETSPRNPNCFAWCLMNVCVSHILEQQVRKMVSGVGLELLGKGFTLLESTPSVR